MSLPSDDPLIRRQDEASKVARVSLLVVAGAVAALLACVAVARLLWPG